MILFFIVITVLLLFALPAVVLLSSAALSRLGFQYDHICRHTLAFKILLHTLTRL